MNNSDMSQYLDVFLDEGREQLLLLEINFLEMERGNHTSEMLQVLFRAAHTLKGSSRAMGFMVVGDLTHEMENILDDLRNDKLAVSTMIVTELLACLDALGQLMDAVASTGNDASQVDVSIPKLVAKLIALRNGAGEPIITESLMPHLESLEAVTGFKLAEHEITAIEAARNSSVPVLHFKVTLIPECQLKSVRVWMVLGALEPLGTVLAAEPSQELLEAEEFGTSFQLIGAMNADISIIETALKSISEIASYEIKQWSDEIPSASTAQKPNESVVKKSNDAEKTIATNKAALSQVQTIRVEVSRLDTLLNLVGELVIERSQIHQVCSDLHRKYPRDEDATHLLETTNRIARVTAELQDQIMKTRLLPIDGVFQRMPRMVRDLSLKIEKIIRFEMYGGETELDRTVLESIADPIIHLLRNSIDHGIELPAARLAAGKPAEGLVTLSARHEENKIVIEVSDDGAGIDPSRLKESAIRKGILSEAAASTMSEKDAMGLIFASGFSTAAALTDISGRGVGMDIVKSNLEKISGRIVVDSVIGRGSRFIIHLPMTLAIVRAVLAESSCSTFVLPIGSIIEMLQLGNGDGDTAIRRLGGQPVIDLRGRTIPLANLTDLVGNRNGATWHADIREDAFVVVVGIGERQIGLCVDALVGEQEVVIKSMGTLLGDISGLSGATILGDGKVALIVDVSKAVERVNLVEPSKRELSIVK
jgi:two-component system chemotaxis sensor kinase CheA